MTAEEAIAGKERDVRAYRRPLITLVAFNLLGCILTASNYYWPAVVDKMWKEWKKWERMSRILVREWADLRMMGNFFNVVVQAVLLFGSET